MNALLPFIVEELAANIVSTAVIDLVSLAPMRNGDPMNVPMTVVDLIRAGAITNVGAAFGGLLCLGDSRVCRLLVPLRDTLNKAQVQVAIHCQTDFMHALPPTSTSTGSRDSTMIKRAVRDRRSRSRPNTPTLSV